MESPIAMYCEACQKSYESKDTSPRCLSCGHIFCSTCVSSLTDTKIKCPRCDATINILCAEDIDSLNTSFHKSSSPSPIDFEQGNKKGMPLEGEMKYPTTDRGFDSENINPILLTEEEGISEKVRHLSSCSFTGIEDEKTEEIKFIDEENYQECPVVLIQRCESIVNSDCRQRRTSTNSLPVHAIPKRGTDEYGLSKSADDANRLESDSTDLRKELLMVPLLEHHTKETLEDLNEQSKISRKDSLVVHHSSSCNFDNLLDAREISCSTSQDDTFQILKRTELQKFADQIQILNEVLETVDDAILTLKVEQKQHETTKAKLLQSVQEEEESIELLRMKIEEAEKKKITVQQITENLRESEEKTAKAESVDKFKDSVDSSSDVLAIAEDTGTQTELFYMHYLLSRNVRKPEYLERMIDLGVEVFAVYLVDGERRWARVSLSDSLIHLHALKPRSPPAHSRILPWLCLREMVPPKETATFLDIYIAGTKQGRIYFTMHGNTPRSQQFVLLSSGERKHCYRNVKMKQVGNFELPGEYVSFHGPKHPNGAPIRGVVGGIKQGGIYTRRKVKGLLAGAALSHRQRTLFVVYLSSDPDEDTTGAFGEVTRGIEVLTKVSRHIPVEEVEIGDCGLVIPLPSSTT